MSTFKVDDNHEQAGAFIAYLHTLPYVEFLEEENEADPEADTDDRRQEIDTEKEKALEKYDLKDIAGELDLGMWCYVNQATGEVVSIPKDLDMFDDEEGLWQEMQDRVNENLDDYIVITPPEPSQSFEIMETFVETLPQSKLRKQLADALANRKPFRNFNNIIHNSDVRQEWFEHKSLKEREYVREQLLYALDLE